MAILYPNIENIRKMKPQPEAGELHLILFLSEALDDTYEIFFQPYLNGDEPDIIILRKTSGLLIIEVKDWDISNYRIDNKGRWHLTEGTSIKSPFSQVFSYKENLFSLHIDDLLSKQIINPMMFSTVSCAVYFHNADEKEINRLILSGDKDEKYRKWIRYIHVLGKDSLTINNIKNILHSRFLDRKSKIFDDELYSKIRRFLLPTRHVIEQGKEIKYSKEQKALIVSKAGDQKIKGVAGCGKTLVLAKRAVNAYLRTRGSVLLLTFNITLRNYIHDRLSDVRDEFDWSNFLILHYHQFISSQANNYNLNYDFMSSCGNVDFFERVKDQLPKYSAILIDEGQDYFYEWLLILKKYFLANNGEFVIFADEKQNIYGRLLDNDKKTKTNIPGRWNEQLKATRRLSSTIINLANSFQKEFWSSKYTYDDIQSDLGQDDLFANEEIDYKYFQSEVEAEAIIESVYGFIVENNIHSNDVGIISTEVELLREIDYKIRRLKKEKTRTMFETKEVYDYLISYYEKKGLEDEELRDKLEEEVDKIRRSKKFNFWMNPGTVKISTIHSFKGWEIDTLFLILTDKTEVKHVALEELIYTGITRARRNLFIFNIGNKKFDDFFENELSQIKGVSSL